MCRGRCWVTADVVVGLPQYRVAQSPTSLVSADINNRRAASLVGKVQGQISHAKKGGHVCVHTIVYWLHRYFLHNTYWIMRIGGLVHSKARLTLVLYCTVLHSTYLPTYGR